MSGNIPLIIWSGGYDSTALVLDCYERAERFDLLSIDIINNKNKVICETKAQNKILSTLKPNKLLRNHYRWECGNISNSGDWRLSQPVIWLTAVMMFLRKEHYQIKFGYYKGADPLNGTDILYTTFNEMFKLCRFDFKRPEISIPFLLSDKETIFRDWYFNDDYALGKKIYPHIWTCEGPLKKGRGYIECKKCVPCLSKYKTLCIIENFNQ